MLWSSYVRSDPRLQRPPEITGSVGGGTFAWFEEHGFDVEVARVRTGAAIADAGVADLLGTAPGAATMVQHRQTLSPQGEILEVAIGYYRSDLVYLSNDFHRPPRAG